MDDVRVIYEGLPPVGNSGQSRAHQAWETIIDMWLPPAIVARCSDPSAMAQVLLGMFYALGGTQPAGTLLRVAVRDAAGRELAVSGLRMSTGGLIKRT
jgi:hypothetical protein